jgi:hypothetical protein
MNEREKVTNTLNLLEHLFRVTDTLDEQLHAGFYFYIFTSKTTFVSNSNFVYPLVILLHGYNYPQLFSRYGQLLDNKDYQTD